MDETRRRFLAGGAGAIAAASVAGCLDSLGSGAPSVGSGSEGDTAAMASFFTLADFARNVGGDVLEVANAIPTGQHGHGWEPQSDITVDAVERDVFVYLGLEGFQRWADDVASEIETNHDDVAVIAASEGVDLSEYGEPGHAEGDDHDHGDYDPHFWVDPVRARQAVETIRDQLVEVGDDNTETYEENAESYIAKLEELHDRFEEELTGRDHDTVVVAGHDSYGYLAERYGFEIHTPQGVSPDDEASPGEIAETVDLVESEGIEVILYDYFDGDTLARTIRNEADAATDVAMLSSTESITEEWESEGLDYIGQMEGITLPSLRDALGAGT